MDRRVAVTGIGAVTPVGNSAEETWQALKAGRSGVGKIDTFDASTFPVTIAGTVKGFDLAERVPDAKDREHLSRAAGFGVAAALEALEDAGLDGAYEPHEIGVGMAGSVGRPGLETLLDMSWTLKESDGTQYARVEPSDVLARDQNVMTATIGRLAQAEGPTSW